MSRLTKKYEDNYNLYIKLPTIKKQEFLNKLGKLEDLEEELGCPLEVLFKALKNSVIYYQNNNGYTYEMRGIGLKYLNEWCLTDGNHYPDVKDYKKTWWLREDKSE